MINCFIVGLGGAVGAMLRYLIGLIPLDASNNLNNFPIKTFAINVLGAFAIGIIAAFAAKGELNPKLVLFLKVGICGGFTTFSSFALEINQLAEKGQTFMGILYAVLSLIFGVAAVFLAEKIV